MSYVLIALALSPQCSTREVYRRLLEGLSDRLSYQDEVSTASALCQRRQQLAVTPLRSLFARIARPQALPQTRSAFRFGSHMAADGTLEIPPDTDANRNAFPSHCQERVPARRLRLQARVVKRTRSRYPRKWYDHLHAPCLTELFLDLVVLRI
jgi:hypothetical protein